MSARLSINLNDATAEALKELQREQGLSATEVVRRAITLYKFISDETRGTKKKLQIVDRKGKEVTTVEIMF